MMNIGLALLFAFLATKFVISQCNTNIQCYSCNSGLKGQEGCKNDKIEQSRKFLVNCSSGTDYDTAFNFLPLKFRGIPSNYTSLEENGYIGVKHWGTKFKDGPEARSMEAQREDREEENLMNTTYLPGVGAHSSSDFVCRIIVIKVPFPRTLDGQPAEDERIIRRCGVRFKEGKKEENGCVAVRGSSKISIRVCTCNKNVEGKPCNGIGYFKGSRNILGFFTLLLGTLNSNFLNGKIL